MGADQRALVALDAVFDLPFGYVDGDAALLILRGGGGHAAVRREGGYRQLVAFLRQNRADIAVIVLSCFHMRCFGAFGRVGPAFGHLDLLEAGNRDVDGVPVLLDHGFALAAVGVLGIFLHVAVGFLVGDHLSQLEERGLHDGVDAGAHADLGSQADGVDIIEARFFQGQLLLHVGGQAFFHFLSRPGAVEQEDAALLECVDHVVSRDIGGVMAGDEVREVDLIGRLDGGLAKAQVGDGQAAGFLGVIGEVALRVQVGVIADNLDGVLVGADGAVAAQAVELAAHGARGRGVQTGAKGQAGMGHVILNAHGEMVLGIRRGHVVIDCLDHGGRELLGAHAVAAADDHDVFTAVLAQHGGHILVQGLAQAAGFLRAVKHGQALHGSGQRLEEVFCAEGAVEVHLEHAVFLALLFKGVNGFFNRFGA